MRGSDNLPLHNQLKYALCSGKRLFLVGAGDKISILWWLVRGTDSGEVLDYSCLCLFIYAFGVPGGTEKKVSSEQ